MLFILMKQNQFISFNTNLNIQCMHIAQGILNLKLKKINLNIYQFIKFGEGMSLNFQKKTKTEWERLTFSQQFIRTPEQLKSKIIQKDSTLSKTNLKTSKSFNFYQESHRKINILLVPDYAHETVLQSLINEQKKIQKQKIESSQSQLSHVEVYRNQSNSYKFQFQKLSKLLNQKSLINKYLWQSSGQDTIEGTHSLKDRSKYEVKYCIQFQESTQKYNKEKHLSSIIQDDSDKMRQSANQIKNKQFYFKDTFKTDDQIKIPYVLAQKSVIIKKSKKADEKKMNVGQLQKVNTDLNTLLHDPDSINFRKMNSIYSNKNTCAKTSMRSESQKNSYSQMVRDLNLNIWHAHGLKFRSNVLKFGLQKKEIVIIVYHKEKDHDAINLCQQWSKFIRQTNKKCIIGHMFINEKTQKESGQTIRKNENGAIHFEQFEDEIEIQQNHQLKLSSLDIRKYKNEKQFDINIKIHKTKNSSPNASVQRILKVVDHLLCQIHAQSNESGFFFSKQENLSYSRVLKNPKNYGSQKIKKSPPFELDLSCNFSFDYNYSVQPINQKHIQVRLDHLKSEKKKEQKEQQGSVLKNLRKTLCCNQIKVQKQQIYIKVEKSNSYMIPNRNNRTSFDSYSMNLRNEPNKRGTRKKSVNFYWN